MLAALLLAATLGGAIWTVDDDGPADFASIQAAIDSALVLDGDVLLVYPGNHTGFELTKALDVLAATGASFVAREVVVRDVARFTISGLHAQHLTVRNVPGRARIDQCRVAWTIVEPNTPALLWSGRARFENCAQVLLTRSELRGSESCYPYVISNYDPALTLNASNAAVVDCVLYGGNDDICAGHPVFRVSPAILAENGSDVTVSGCDLTGGDGVGFFVAGEPAVEVQDSVVRIRGESANQVRAGAGGVTPAMAVDGSTSSSAEISGVSWSPPALPAWVVAPAPPAPFLVLHPAAGPGLPETLAFHGPLGSTAVVAFSRAPTFQPTAQGPQWISPAAPMRIVRIAGLGQDVPSTASVHVALIGASVGSAFDLQARVRIAGVDVLTNPVQTLAR